MSKDNGNTNTEVQVADKPQGGLATIESFTPDQIALIKSNIAVGATDDELKLFLYQAQKTGLDPLAGQCHFVRRWDSVQGKHVGKIQTGIDGFRLVAQRAGSHAGTSEVAFGYAEGDLGKLIPVKAKVTVYRFIRGEKVAFPHTVHFAEYVQKKKDGDPTKFWRDMPHVMLGKCAEAGALRKAFPHDLSGLYTSDEMAQAKNSAPTEAKAKKGKAVKPATPLEVSRTLLLALCKETKQPNNVLEFLKMIKEKYPTYWTVKFLDHVIKGIKANGGSAWDIPDDPIEFFKQFA